MRALTTLVLFAILHCALSKNNVKSLTESLGQEVIEIGAPIKDLPQDLEEEPSAENDEDYKSTATVQPAATKKDIKKTTLTTVDTRRKGVQDKTTKPDDEEARIEKELAEIYKDNLDYKSDSSEVVKDATTIKNQNLLEEDAKPVARSKVNFKFQPDMTNNKEIEKFRTSIDEISCDKRTKLSATVLSHSSLRSYERLYSLVCEHVE
ncbi:uncharacterized protein LOC135085153 [Ostrinia nubilalis]|uniref:uncharacterized protein LOC135085153 n=1 Tax=Ostrinia nubilalis TaxID=29057 RepID=UPI00308237F0